MRPKSRPFGLFIDGEAFKVQALTIAVGAQLPADTSFEIKDYWTVLGDRPKIRVTGILHYHEPKQWQRRRAYRQRHWVRWRERLSEA